MINNSDLNAEDLHQKAVIFWAKHFPALKWLYAIPNGSFLAGDKIRRAKQMNRLKAEGLKVGVFDLCLPVARNGYHGMYIEMKRADGKGRLSENQKDFGKDVSENGYLCVVCVGSEQAIQEIKDYMGI